MNVYRPKQRTIKARILTVSGWINGSFNIPTNAFFLDYMNRPAAYDILTQVTIDQYWLASDFLMVQRRHIILIHFPEKVPELQDLVADETTATRNVFCLTDRGIIRGSISLLRNIRVSDHFKDRRGFALLRKCRYLLILPPPEGKLESQYDVMLVNTEHILGVSDSLPALLPREPGSPATA